MMRRPLLRAAAAVTCALVLASCKFNGLQSWTLPGGNATGSHYTLTAEFADTLNLVPQSAVRVHDIPVGDVTSISLDKKTLLAKVNMRIKSSVKLPENTVAVLKITSLLGERYISLDTAPGQQPQGTLQPGSIIPNGDTRDQFQVEDLFAAMSALFNGGGLAQLHTITVELNRALSGREGTVRDLLSKLTTFVGAFDARKNDITRLIDNLNALSTTLGAQTGTIAQALDTIPPAVGVLANQSGDLTHALASLANLGTVGSRIIRASEKETVTDLNQLKTFVQILANSKSDIAALLRDLPQFSYWFQRSTPSDYLNLYLTASIDPSRLPSYISQLLGGSGGGSPLVVPSSATRTDLGRVLTGGLR